MLGFCNFAKLQNPNTHKRAQTSAGVILIFVRHRLLITRLQL